MYFRGPRAMCLKDTRETSGNNAPLNRTPSILINWLLMNTINSHSLWIFMVFNAKYSKTKAMNTLFVLGIFLRSRPSTNYYNWKNRKCEKHRLCLTKYIIFCYNCRVHWTTYRHSIYYPQCNDGCFGKDIKVV